MINVYTKTDNGLEQISELMPGTWIQLIDPQPSEVERVLAAIDIPEDFVTAALDEDERARTDREENATLIILRVPHLFGLEDSIPYRTVPFGMILCPGYLITVCKYHTGISLDLLRYRVKGLSTTKHTRLILQILLVTSQKYLMYLRRIDSAIESIENRLQRSLHNEEVLELLKYQNCLVYFTSGLKANQFVMQRLQKSRFFDQFEEDQDLLEDVLIENSQALEMTQISENILSQDMDAFASIISNNLNVVMKFLASVTIILSLPTLVASLYGMNVDLPFQGMPWAFAIVIALSIILAVGVSLLFWRRDWL